VTGWFPGTAVAESTPLPLIDAYPEFSLHTGATEVVVPSLHKAVAAYVAVPFSLTDDGPAIDSEDKVAAMSTIVTDAVAVRVRPPLA